MSVLEVDLFLQELHPKQQEIIDNAGRFNHLRCGRRFGKTTLIAELSSISLDVGEDQEIGWPVGIWFPTYKDLSEVWKELKKLYKPVIARKDEQLKQIELLTGGIIDFWSMEDPDSGQGRKYRRAIIDESAKAPKLYQAWENTIRPTLTDYKGDAFILSRPKGRNNGFYRLEEKHKQFDNWRFHHYTTYDNPHIDPAEVDEAKAQLDDINFRQEYMAEYVDANDKPFLYAFDQKKHVIKSYKPNENLALIVSFDFNKEPMTCIVGQSMNVRHLCVFDEIKVNNGSTPELCEQIVAKYPAWIGRIFITGDASGKNRSPLVRGGLNHYTLIKKALGAKDFHMKVRSSNASHINSRVLCNSVVQNADFHITENCKETILDCAYAGVNDEGEIIKTKDQGRHFFDNFRYITDAQFYDFIDNPKKYVRK